MRPPRAGRLLQLHPRSLHVRRLPSQPLQLASCSFCSASSAAVAAAARGPCHATARGALFGQASSGRRALAPAASTSLRNLITLQSAAFSISPTATWRSREERQAALHRNNDAPPILERRRRRQEQHELRLQAGQPNTASYAGDSDYPSSERAGRRSQYGDRPTRPSSSSPVPKKRERPDRHPLGVFESTDAPQYGRSGASHRSKAPEAPPTISAFPAGRPTRDQTPAQREAVRQTRQDISKKVKLSLVSC